MPLNLNVGVICLSIACQFESGSMLLYAKIFAILTLRALITIGRGSEDSGYQHLVHNFANYYPTFNFCFH